MVNFLFDLTLFVYLFFSIGNGENLRNHIFEKAGLLK